MPTDGDFQFVCSRCREDYYFRCSVWDAPRGGNKETEGSFHDCPDIRVTGKVRVHFGTGLNPFDYDAIEGNFDV